MKSWFFFGFVVGIIFILVASFCAIVFFAEKDISDRKNDVPKLTKVPDFGELKSLELQQITSQLKSNIKGDAISIINLWQTWCGPCHKEMASLLSLERKYITNPKIKFYIISGEPITKIQESINKNHYTGSFYRVTNSSKLFQEKSVPETYIVYRNRILFVETGSRNWLHPKVTSLLDSLSSNIE